jgi:pimeloyl-ACP methyl ester carboxylesterase
MFVEVNGAKLYFDVEGAGLVPDGSRMVEKPTLLLLHGGPGFDHTSYKPAFSALADLAQIVYVDHRGNGRSDGEDPATWNLAQWGDDVRAFCDVLGIERPVVYGASFGGMVALAYATRHPDHPGKLILVSTEAAGHSHLERRVALFERLGGPQVGALAHRRLLWGTTPGCLIGSLNAGAESSPTMISPIPSRNASISVSSSTRQKSIGPSAMGAVPAPTLPLVVFYILQKYAGAVIAERGTSCRSNSAVRQARRA